MNIAKLFRYSNKLTIESDRCGNFIVTDHIFLIKLKGDDYIDFRHKYSSYKNTPNIPDICLGGCWEMKMEFQKRAPFLFNTLKEKQNLSPATLTDIVINDNRIITAKGQIKAFNNKYYQLLKGGDILVNDEINTVFLVEGDCKVMLALFKDNFKEVIEEQLGCALS